MPHGPDRRRTDAEAARRRREQQQRHWEQSAHAGPGHVSEAFAQVLGALVHASHRLPACDRSAKLHAALSRLADATDHSDACAAARALVTASELALADDPWFQFHRAAADAVTTVCDTAEWRRHLA